MKKSQDNSNYLSYISLFSSAGIGCYGFKKENFKCIATCEYLKKRLDIQRINKKCDLQTGYIEGDIRLENVYNKIFEELKKWKLKDGVDVVIATPPCQGMSVANQKKRNEIKRNSLIIKSIELIKEIKPKIFIFENVQKFLKTKCIGMDGRERTIGEEIEKELNDEYLYSYKIINFKNYGSNSSRTRTLVIGVKNKYLNLWSPFELFPDFQKEKTIRDVIGKFKSLKNMNEYDEENLLHYFKEYDSKMIPWIESLKEGESAFQNKEKYRIPHKIENGKYVKYVDTFGDKYKRQYWDKVAPCIHTANDCLASQNTIHPTDNRVFSIAELMELMTIPNDFKWSNIDINSLDHNQKIKWIKENQSNIRRCIGEAVPTTIFQQIARKIKNNFIHNIYDDIKKYEVYNPDKKENAAYFTDKKIISYIFDHLPTINKNKINILEPSIGGGSFLLPLFKKYENIEIVNLYLNDISENSLNFVKKNIIKMGIPKNFKIHYINSDFLKKEFDIKFDLIIGNPPFKKINGKNLFELFWEKSLNLSDRIIFINPKFLLSSPSYKNIRENLLCKYVEKIIDLGEIGFKDAKIETIIVFVNKNSKSKINIISIPKKINIIQDREYILNSNLPYWIIYRNSEFDFVYEKMKKDIFKIYKNYEISNKKMSINNKGRKIWVIRSKNIDINTPKILSIKNYDKFAEKSIIETTNFYKYIISSKNDLYLIPTMTYYPRVVKMPKNVFVNGSVLVAELKDPHIVLNNNDINYYYSNQFRKFYSIAFNYSTRTLNIDNNTIKFFGVIR